MSTERQLSSSPTHPCAFSPRRSLLPQPSFRYLRPVSPSFFLASPLSFLSPLFFLHQLCSPWLCTGVAMTTAGASLHPAVAVLRPPRPWGAAGCPLPLGGMATPSCQGGVIGDTSAAHPLCRQGWSGAWSGYCWCGWGRAAPGAGDGRDAGKASVGRCLFTSCVLVFGTRAEPRLGSRVCFVSLVLLCRQHFLSAFVKASVPLS